MATTNATTTRCSASRVTRDERAIKKAFRSLARELHPDVSEDANAEERFRELAEAYEVLSKPETRELYDRYGHEGLRTGGFRPSALRLREPLRHLLGVLRGRSLRRHGGRPAPAARRRRPGRGRDRAPRRCTRQTREVRFTVAATCAPCGEAGPRRAPARDVPGLQRGRSAGTDLQHRLRPVRARAGLPRCNGGGRSSPSCAGTATELDGRRRAPARGHDPAGIHRRPAHPPFRGRTHRLARASGPGTRMSSSASGPTSASSAKETTSSRLST